MRTTANDSAKLNDRLNSVKKRTDQQLSRFLEPMVVDAEMRKRGVRFIPSQYVKKCVRSAVYKLKKLGSVRLDDHNVILGTGGGFENTRSMMKYHEQYSFSSQGNT
jgi:hypothetical protein